MPPRHHRVSSADQETSAAASHTLQLQALVRLISEAVASEDSTPEVDTLQKCGDDLAQVRRLIIDAPASARVQDEFRRCAGLEACIKLWRSLNARFREGFHASQDCATFFEIIKSVFDVLSEVLGGNVGNQDYFEHRISGRGWTIFSQLFHDSWSCISNSNFDGLDVFLEISRLLGLLFAFALREEALAGFFRSIVTKSATGDKSLKQTGEAEDESSEGSEVNYSERIRGVVRGQLSQNETLWFANAAALLYTVSVEKFPISKDNEDRLFATIVVSLSEIARTSEYNLVSLHRTGVLSLVLRELSNNDPLSLRETAVRELFFDLAKLGFNSLVDARRLFSLALESDRSYGFLASCVKNTREPPHFHFDLSLYGYSSLELASVAGAFPHADGSAGYTFMCWLRIDKFDSSSHTTLFGAFDESQTAFLLLYLECKSHQLVLQTSTKSSRPSTRFKSLVFREGIWYHIAITHRKGRGEATAASLFVNGEMTETVPVRYPDHVPLTRAPFKNTSSTSGPGNRSAPVQAFLGTPHDLSPRLGQNVVFSKWSLATAYLFNEIVQDELILVYQKLGPFYHGNFQDCLGSFQTYQASATLNLLNENLHPGREENSLIFRAIHGKAGELVSEKRISVGISAASTVQSQGASVRETGFQVALPNAAQAKAGSSTRFKNAVAFNSAIPSIRQAVKVLGGTALLTGDTVVFRTKTIHDLAWSACGCIPLCLKIIENANSAETFLAAVSICFEIVRKSWRISEIMETEDGFGALAWLLRRKLDLLPKIESNGNSTSDPPLSELLLMRILRFVGYNEKKPSASVIINPLAYRVLLVDSGIWQSVEVNTQKIYYRQLGEFLASTHGGFNSRRLTRMRIIKKFLAYFQIPGLDKEVVDDALQAFRTLLEATMSSEVLRAVALYVTYTVHIPSSLNNSTRPRAPSLRSHYSNSEIPADRRVAATEVGYLVLEAVTDMLCSDKSTIFIHKLGKSVTNKWLLHLLAESNPRVVTCAVKILARLLVSHGQPYIQKFDEKTKGFVILGERLRKVWHVPGAAASCFVILFGLDVGSLALDRCLDPDYLLESIVNQGKPVIFCPQILPAIGDMLQGAVLSKPPAPDSHEDVQEELSQDALSVPADLNLDPRKSEPATAASVDASAIIRTIQSLHSHLQSFRDFAIESTWVRILLKCIYVAEKRPVMHENNLDYDGPEVDEDRGIMRSFTSPNSEGRDVHFEETAKAKTGPADPLQLMRRRASSFVVVRSGVGSPGTVTEPSQPLRPSGLQQGPFKLTNIVSTRLIACIEDIFRDQLFCRKDFPGLGLFLKSPPSATRDQTMISSLIITQILTLLRRFIVEDPQVFHDSRSLTNLAKFLNQTCEALYEGWFVDDAHNLLFFTGELLVHLQTSPAKDAKGVKWSTAAVNSMQDVFVKSLMQLLSFCSRTSTEDSWISGFDQLRPLVAFGLPSEGHEEPLNLGLLFLTYRLTAAEDERLSRDALSLFRTLLQSRPDDFLGVFDEVARENDLSVAESVLRAAQGSDKSLFSMMQEHRKSLDLAFESTPSSLWEQFITEENGKRHKSAKTRLAKRKERLEQLHLRDLENLHALTEHDGSTRNWNDNIQASERMRLLKTRQDLQENLAYHSTAHARLCRRLETLSLVTGAKASEQWQLDDVEGHDRMRFRLSKIYSREDPTYQPKHSASKPEFPPGSLPWKSFTPALTPQIQSQPQTPPGEPTDKSASETRNKVVSGDMSAQIRTTDEDFELVSKPLDDDEQMDDKNRKVMRSLQRGEQVVDVLNATRIRGLGAWQTLLIIGKGSMYLVDHLFQRSDGEVVQADQAPKEERDPYMESLLDGKKVDSKENDSFIEIEAKHWPWHEIISISKRHFLFRDVAIEIFFGDGRSCLLTLATTTARDQLYTSLFERATTIKYQVSGKREESAWRMEMLRNPRDAVQSLGAKFANVFSQNTTPFTRQWIKGEMSNFHYLMMINTMAGRSFNDLTQYPVFPWVLADYTSEELDLTNPASFRDFSKPMGCQTPGRESAFRDRYQSFAEMLDSQTPAFHYGTHYSSAMIVSSYLMRLQPFVESYLLLQGGRFDHPERLFSSINKAWLSSSRETMTDVRELTPEFFYLPDFLTNVNGYDFGQKRDGSSIDNVELPPWAKGDPAIFIAKHREALESPHVSQNLHEWINLVFGSKQRGEAAIEATNVFHYLSYHGAKDLDAIEDEHEKLATIGIIHNFGQTPRQVFTRTHDKREDTNPRFNDVVKVIKSLRRMPGVVCNIGVPVTYLYVSPKHQRILATGPNQIYLPPYFNALLEWEHSDNSVRFYATQHKPNVFEQLHLDQISTAIFADSKTLITASMDCTIAVWNLDNEQKYLQLHPKGFLFGHLELVSSLAVSNPLSTLVSASADGKVIVWDFNRLEMLRVLHEGPDVERIQINNYNGHIFLCCRQTAYLYTLNGQLLVTQNLCSAADDRIFCCAFLEPEGDEWLGHELIFTGHRRGGVNIWNLIVNKEGKWELELLHRLQNSDQTRGDGFDYTAAITCILPKSHQICIGDEDGRVSEWEFIR